MSWEVTVVMPAFNEGSTLAGVLAKLERDLAPLRARYETEVLVVDDGSTDETADIIAAFTAAHRPAFRAVTHARNRGLTEAMKTGARAAEGRIVVFLDADLSYAPAVAEELVTALEREGASVALASPYMPGGRVGNVPVDRLIASRAANFLLAACVGFTVHTFTGMVRAYDRTALLELFEHRVKGEFNAWLIAELLHAGKPVIEVPAALVWPSARRRSPSRMSAATWRRRTGQVFQTVAALKSAHRGPRERLPTGLRS